MKSPVEMLQGCVVKMHNFDAEKLAIREENVVYKRKNKNIAGFVSHFVL